MFPLGRCKETVEVEGEEKEGGKEGCGGSFFKRQRQTGSKKEGDLAWSSLGGGNDELKFEL